MIIGQSGGRMDLHSFVEQAGAWLAEHAESLTASGDAVESDGDWGRGSDGVEVFHDLGDDEERSLLDRAMAWQREKFDAGYGALTWPAEFGGAGLCEEFAAAFDELEAGYVHPPHHETFTVTLHLVAPTLAQFGQKELRAELVPRLLRTETLSCQLFSEPGAGSDLGALATRAERDGDSWVINGQKTWSSGARFAEWGELVARSDLDVPKHQGMTAFMLAMDSPGVTIRPIRQMSGGSSFNEVFFSDVRIPDAHRLGEIGEGWRVALTTLGFERRSSGSGRGASTVGGSFQQLLALARWLDRTDDPLVRQRLADVYAHERLREFVEATTLAGAANGGAPGPSGSIGKLLWTRSMTRIGAVAAELLGPRMTADTGEWGTYAWTKHLLGAPGYQIAGGSDEIQHDIIGNRVLGLPPEPRPDKGVAFRDVPR
jgi:alkylation response protein AidB-like acyl-CoA dehydrogenase